MTKADAFFFLYWFFWFLFLIGSAAGIDRLLRRKK